MAVLTFPNDQGALDVKYRIALNLVNFVIRIRYNQRADRYYAEIYSAEGNLLRGSVKVVTDTPMFTGTEYDTRLPTALMFPQTLSADLSPPGFDELGEDERVQITIFDGS